VPVGVGTGDVLTKYIVSTGADIAAPNDGVLSLREAVALARSNSGPDRIVFDAGIRRVTLRNGLEIDDPARLDIAGDRSGDGRADVTLTAARKLGEPLLEVAPGSSVGLIGLRVANLTINGLDGRDGSQGASGTASDLGGGAGGSGSPGADAAAVLNHGTLTLTRVSFEAIRVEAGDGGAGGQGGTGSTPAQAGTGLPGSGVGAGGPGGDGADGGDAAGAVLNRGKLTLRDVGATGEIVALAGDGRAGGRGGIGGDGGRGGEGVNNPATFGQGGTGGRGGAGGRSGDGGDGAAAGAAAGGFLSTGKVTARTALAAGGFIEGERGTAGAGGLANYSLAAGSGDRSNGDGGPGGPGGSGGPLGPDGDPGPTGDPGGFGGAGSPGDNSAREVSFWLSNDGPRPDSFDTLIFAHPIGPRTREGGDLEFSIVRLGSSDTSFTVDWELSGRGLRRGDLDRGALAGKVAFSDGGSDIRRVDIDTGRDGRTEGGENFRFRLTGIDYKETTTETAGLGTASLQGRIIDRDGPTDGDDRLLGTRLADAIDGGRGSDLMRGFGDQDLLAGSLGADRILGGKAADELKGNGGADKLFGSEGADILVGGRGPDILGGGAGRDIFRFVSSSDTGRGNRRDGIVDFQHKKDVIDISGLDGDTGRPGNQPFDFVGREDLDGKAGEVNYQRGVIRGDYDGDGQADFAIAMHGNPRIWESDFIV
jgi:RTX calcium-binding nonapeptide repeat (4 copies)